MEKITLLPLRKLGFEVDKRNVATCRSYFVSTSVLPKTVPTEKVAPNKVVQVFKLCQAVILNRVDETPAVNYTIALVELTVT